MTNADLFDRRNFDITHDVAYLNCAYMGPLPRLVNEAGTAAWQRKARPWQITAADFFDDAERFREALARLSGLDAEGFAIVSAVSTGIAIAARNIEVPGAGNVVTLAEQFPSNAYAWREAARLSGASMRVVERDDQGDPMPGLIDAVDENTAVVALAPCHWTDGTRVDLEEIDAIRPAGCRLVLDIAQSFGAMELGLAAVQPDVVVGVMYKWMLGPYSVSFAWFCPDLRDGRPLEHNWIGRADSENFAGLVDYRDDFRPGARRYDMGEVSNFALLPAALQATELIEDSGVANIARHAQTLITKISEGASELGCEPTPAGLTSPHMVGLGLPTEADPASVAARLSDESIYVGVRGRSLRVSAHAFNTAEDAERLIEALARALR